MNGGNEVEECNESEGSDQQEAEGKPMAIANRIRQFTKEIVSSIDTPTSVSNTVNDDEENDVLVVEKYSTEGDEISNNDKNSQAKKIQQIL